MTNRTIKVRCPGPIRRRMMYEIHEGSVWFDADGVPTDETKLSVRPQGGAPIATWQATTWQAMLPDAYRNASC